MRPGPPVSSMARVSKRAREAHGARADQGREGVLREERVAVAKGGPRSDLFSLHSQKEVRTMAAVLCNFLTPSRTKESTKLERAEMLRLRMRKAMRCDL